MPKSPVIAVCARGTDAHEDKPNAIPGNIKASPVAGGDEARSGHRELG